LQGLHPSLTSVTVADSVATMQQDCAPGAGPRSAGVHLLLVEDDSGVRSALAEALTDESYTVTTANNGREALARLRDAAPPDAIILDLMMPVMDGWEFRVAQRADPTLAEIPLLAMSADLSAKARAIAADGYVHKPVDFPALLRALHAIIERATRNRLAVADRMAALGTLAAGIAHEINNPLTYVIANLQTLAQRLSASGGPALDELPEIVADALEGADRIRRLVKDVQKASPRPSSARPALVALADALRAALALTEPHIRERARLRCDLGQNLYVRGDPDRIAELFRNLLLNAAQAIPEGRSADNEIRVDLHELPGRGAAVVRVADTGNGIPPEVQERVFQPFFTTKPIGHGTGLGLSICQGIATALGGEISFSSEAPRGTTFRVVLPTTAGPA
jgi:signal transduction histidine kinase